jgi:hypothetical protein
MTANHQGNAGREAFFERFRDDEAFAEALSSAASMTAAVSLAATHGYVITPEAIVQAATATQSLQHNPLLRTSGEATGQFGVTDPGDY